MEAPMEEEEEEDEEEEEEEEERRKKEEEEERRRKERNRGLCPASFFTRMHMHVHACVHLS
jgi:FtsZ-interacting cell division protein YlmF